MSFLIPKMVMTNSLRTGKSPCYSWENSLEMAMFHSWVSLPEGNWKDCFFPESPLVLDDFRHADTQTQILLLNPTAPEISRKKTRCFPSFPKFVPVKTFIVHHFSGFSLEESRLCIISDLFSLEKKTLHFQICLSCFLGKQHKNYTST